MSREGTDLTIVVGFDGSPRAEDALALADLVAAQSGARLVVACVYVCRPVHALESGQEAQATACRAGRLLDPIRRWEPRAVPALSVERGLLSVMAGERATMLIVGAPRRRRRGRRTLAERLVRNGAGFAVAVAPLGFRARAAGVLSAGGLAR